MLKPIDYGRNAVQSSIPLYEARGGVANATLKRGDLKRLAGALAKRSSAGELNNAIKGKALVVAGNSYTLTRSRWGSIKTLPMLGCNRALMLQTLPWPEYVMCGDREVYCDVRDSGAWYNGTKAGAKLILADSLFDPATILRGRKGDLTNDHLKAQPVPRFKFYRYQAGHPHKDWTYEDVAEGRVVPPFNFSDLGQPLVTGHSVVVSMLQAALALGATKVLAIGFEVNWPAKGRTHFHTSARRRKGFWPFSEKVIKTCLGHIKDEYAKRGINLYNLSPIKGSLFASVFGNHSYKRAIRGD